MKTELSFKEWRDLYLQKIREAGFQFKEFDEELIELVHMEAQEAGKSVDEMAEEVINQLKREAK